MGIADLLHMFTGGGQGAGSASPMPDGAPPQAPAGVAPMLSNAQAAFPDQGFGDAPQPQAAPPAAPAMPAAPITPPADQGGLGGFLQHMIQKATTTDPNTGMSFMDKLGRFGGQITDMSGDTRGAAQGYQDHGDANRATAKRAQLQQMADALGMSPREKLIFQASPEAWVQANAKTLEPATVAGGATRVTPGAEPYTAPLVGQEKGEGYSVSPDGIHDLGGLEQSPQQRADLARQQAQDEATIAYHQAMMRILQQNANSNTTRANRAPAGGGGGASGLPPGYVPR